MEYKVLKYVILVIISIILIACKDYVEIESEIESVTTVPKKIYLVDTKVWVRKWWGSPVTLESWQSETCEKYQVYKTQMFQLDSAREVQAELEILLYIPNKKVE